MTDAPREKHDLVLPPGTYAYMQDVTKGVIKTYTGPTVINPTAQEVPIVYDPKRGAFSKDVTLEEAIRRAIVAVEGYYVQLLNPAKGNKHPEDGTTQPSAELDVGRKIVIPGPAMFPLWPGQAAEVIRGHHLRSNQYLLVRVYNEDEARQNWGSAIVKPAGHAEGEVAPPSRGGSAIPLPGDLTVGKLITIRGTDVSFYIPPTGIVVVPERHDAAGRPVYVREALTLERLEYAILCDEDGHKRYEKGPTVVFPNPTERFVEAPESGAKKFRAIELSEIQGIHLKVIADYQDPDGAAHQAGDELFVTGKDTAIYYPREEHSAIKYDGRIKHFATAVPEGEARYVLHRLTGEIHMVHGPAMLLPDPRHEVIVRRVLSDQQVAQWYPGNAEALDYNRALRSTLARAPASQSAAPAVKLAPRPRVVGEADASASAPAGEPTFVGEEFARSGSYVPPRSITLETKYQGVPTVEVWTGYAVMVVSKSGRRRVEIGPKAVQLEYDEGFEVLRLSTGKPKSTAALLDTVYLRVLNNHVTDVLTVETADHVQVELGLGYRVNFEGAEPTRWFAVENYVKLLCDHVRSVLRGRIRRLTVEAFYEGATDILRDLVLGTAADGGGRPGMAFPENGMRVSDLEVLGVTIADEGIRQLLDEAQHAVVQTNIQLAAGRRDLAVTKEREAVLCEEAAARAATLQRRNELERGVAESDLSVALLKLGNQLQELERQRDVALKDAERSRVGFDAELQREKDRRELELRLAAEAQSQQVALLEAEARSVAARFSALKGEGGFSEALLALSHDETLAKVAEAWSIQRVIGGESVSDALAKVFAGTPLEKLARKLALNAPRTGTAAAGSQPD
ncbi:MAG TPA: hypothetical protein VMB50_10395 [Myxococcales bacterium]|nr:hypothetical protein [Myxococcales bacterium]